MTWKATCDVYAEGIREGLRRAGDLLLEDLYALEEPPPKAVVELIEAMAYMLNAEAEK